jgi:hypothetical protein
MSEEEKATSIPDMLINLAVKGGRGAAFGLLYMIIVLALAYVTCAQVTAHAKIWKIGASAGGALVFVLLAIWAFSPAEKPDAG